MATLGNELHVMLPHHSVGFLYIITLPLHWHNFTAFLY